MAGRSTRPPSKYTKSGRLSAAFRAWRERRLSQAIKESKRTAKKREKQAYAKRARTLAKFVPGLKEYSSAAKITPKAEKEIRRRERQLKHVYNLRPVTAAQARGTFKGKLFAPGVRAVQMSEFESGSKFRAGKKGTTIISNGRTWLLIPMPINWRSKKEAIKAGSNAFRFPLETVIAQAEIAFHKYKPIGISLWAKQGRISRIHGDIEDFVLWINQHWQAGKYLSAPNQDTGRLY
jgi:hypothetical protein